MSTDFEEFVRQLTVAKAPREFIKLENTSGAEERKKKHRYNKKGKEIYLDSNCIRERD